MIFNIPVGGKRSVIVSLYGAASEEVTLTHEKGTVFSSTTDTSGYGGTIELPLGTYTVKGGYTEYSKSVTVDKNTTEIYAMPDGTIVYWYGYMPYTPVASVYMPNGETTNGKAPTITYSTNSFNVKQGAVSGNYCGSALFEDIQTKGGVPVLLSSGKLNTNASPPSCYFCIADEIAAKQFEFIQRYSVGYEETEVQLDSVAAGTYDIAISVRNNALNYHGHLDVYAIYFAE